MKTFIIKLVYCLTFSTFIFCVGRIFFNVKVHHSKFENSQFTFHFYSYLYSHFTPASYEYAYTFSHSFLASQQLKWETNPGQWASGAVLTSQSINGQRVQKKMPPYGVVITRRVPLIIYLSFIFNRTFLRNCCILFRKNLFDVLVMVFIVFFTIFSKLFNNSNILGMFSVDIWLSYCC